MRILEIINHFFNKKDKSYPVPSEHTKEEIKANVSESCSVVQTETGKKEWFVIGDSVIGKSHIQMNLPCQDSHYFEKFDNYWGIAITADGAGSATNSHIGSAFIAREASPILFRKLVVEKGWVGSSSLPSENDWQSLSKETLKEIRGSLEVYANNNNIETKSLACTLIVVIYSPYGFLTTHIGDGRAGYRNLNNEWKPMITPWKGEEANETIFMTSDIWHDGLDNYIESRVINEKSSAFTLMTDGCEKHSFECSHFDNIKNEWTDPNKPYPKFFEPIATTLTEMKKNNTPFSEIRERWKNFLEKGNEGLKNESDDKTMIFGISI